MNITIVANIYIIIQVASSGICLTVFQHAGANYMTNTRRSAVGDIYTNTRQQKNVQTLHAANYRRTTRPRITAAWKDCLNSASSLKGLGIRTKLRARKTGSRLITYEVE